MTLSFVYHVDLPETWSDLKKALRQIAPNDTSLSQLLGKVLLHHISAGIQHAGALPDEKKTEELRTFLTTTTDLNLGENAEDVLYFRDCIEVVYANPCAASVSKSQQYYQWKHH